MKIVPANLSKRDSHELLMSAILPRPIAFVSTVGKDGTFNVAPFSCFAPVGMKPALVCLQIGSRRDGQKKDTLENIEFSKDFVVNVVDESFADAMNQASFEYPSVVDEFEKIGLTPAKCEIVKAPRVAESPINMECRLLKILKFGEVPAESNIIIGELVLVHVKDELWVVDHIDVSKWRPIGRLGEDLYCRMTDIFEMKKPEVP